MQSLMQDFRYGLRVLVKTPGFTAIAVLTLALGIGANTAIFSIVNTVLLRPLPFQDSQRLVALGISDTRDSPAIPRESVSYPDVMDVRARNHSFQEISVYSDSDSSLTGIGEPLHVNIENVSAIFSGCWERGRRWAGLSSTQKTRPVITWRFSVTRSGGCISMLTRQRSGGL